MNSIFMTVLNMSATGSFVIAAVCLARLLLKKAPKSASYLLWLVVGFRLLFPFSVESAFGLIPFSAQPIPQQFIVWNMPAPPPSQLPPATGEAPAFQGETVIPGSSLPPPAGQMPPAQSPAQPLRLWPDTAAWLWLTGFVAMMLYGAISYYMLSLKMTDTRHIFANVYRAGNIDSPFVMGLIRPKIYIPVHLGIHGLEYVLLHEQAHINRRDHIVKLVAYFALALHWFNPLAWVSFLLMGKDMEMSCDERVIRKMGGGIKKDYSLTLLTMATGSRLIGASPLAFGEGGIRERVKNVLNFKRPSQVFVVFTLVLVLILSIGLAMNRSDNESGISPEGYPYTEAGAATDDDPDTDAEASSDEPVLPAAGTPYVGAAHETGRIVGLMPLPAQGWQVQGILIGDEDGGEYGPYTLTVFYEPQDFETAWLMSEVPRQVFEANSAFLFEHIGNLKAVYFSVFIGQTGQVDRDVFFYRWYRTHDDSIMGHLTINYTTPVPLPWTDEDRAAAFEVRRAGALTGPIAINNSRLYIDPVEIIFSTDHERVEELITQRHELWPDHDWSVYDIMPNGYYIRHINVEIVSWNDDERIAELGLDPDVAFADGWPYENPLPAQTYSFEITPDTIFEFVDLGLVLPCTIPNGLNRAVNLELFLQARPHLADTALIGASTFRRIPMYVHVNENGQVVRVIEEFLLTQ